MRILLTGAGGFVGHHTLEHFLRNTEWDIVVTDSFKHFGTSARIREILDANPAEAHRVTVVTHDLTTPIDSVTSNIFGDVEIIFNLASESHVDRSIENPAPFINNNVALITSMLEYARTLPNLRAFIQVSTDEIYGPAALGYAHKEWDPVIPSSPYSASKAAQEAISIAYRRTYDVPVIITNTMNVIGERQNIEKFVPKIIKAVLSDKPITIHGSITNSGFSSGSRYYLHARNQADALMFIANKVLSGTQIRYSEGVILPERFNVLGDLEVSNIEMVNLISDIVGKKPIVDLVDFHSSRPGHDLRYALDGSKLSSWGWNAPVEFEESLRKTVLWTIDHPIWLDK